MKTTLLVMAAGLGSRYGGNKQVDRLGPNGEILLEYAVYDALQAGFNKVVFVIRRSMEAEFRALIGDKIAKQTEVHYAFQESDTLPQGFVPPADRVKPYGTVHAVLCAADCIAEPFAVINADDYYGKEAFAAMAESLHALVEEEHAASMVAYRLDRTLSKNGTVTRGVCEVDGSGFLRRVTETYAIRACGDGTIRDQDASGQVLPGNAPVSMNFWGFSPKLFEQARRLFTDFLWEKAGSNPLKAEYPLPVLVDDLMRSGELKVHVLHSPSSWFGVTYREDRPTVMALLKQLHERGDYPEKL